MSKQINYTINLDADLGNLESKLNAAKASLERLTMDGKHPELTKMFDSIGKSIDNLRKRAAQPINSEATFGNMHKDIGSITVSIGKLISTITELSQSTDGAVLEFLPTNFVEDINKALSAVAQYENAIEKSTQKTKEMTIAEKDLIKTEEQLTNTQNKRNDAEVNRNTALLRVQQIRQEIDASDELIAQRERELQEAEKNYNRLQQLYNSGEGGVTKEQVSEAGNKVTTSRGNLENEQSNNVNLTAELEGAEKVVSGFENEMSRLDVTLSKLEIKLDNCRTKVQQLNAEFAVHSAEKQKQAFENLRKTADQLGISLDGVSPDGTADDINLLNQRFSEFASNGMSQAQDAAQQATGSLGNMNVATQQLTNSVNAAHSGFIQTSQAMGQLNTIQQWIGRFLSATGVAQIFTKSLRNAFETIKELDKAMTEMAVVTELDVGDYWDQMPEYSERAQELGISLKGAYEAATLFYQQGLETNEVVALSNQTLKMAKIAGLDAAEATDRMTAALRGFNMELNEESAERVADVYSQLAAVTASDVDEISTAMTKTASIASSAGMEFETTAAFLSQIIETTRESAETAGTAMKTVIARFQELKKDPAEIGEVDGEIVDANKIETALRTVGVSLRDAQGQFRDLDDVFLELASKWDSLDTNTQRYIATIAAGSRQQSRFIAMMSDYGRTQELVGEAQNSAGASTKQYEKTLDSLESKLAQLKNAWDVFTTGIMNSDLVKFFVDLLTNILNAINKVTVGFDSFTNSLSKIGVFTTVFKLAKAAFASFSKFIKTQMFNAGQSFGQGVASNFNPTLTKMRTEAQQFNKEMQNTANQPSGKQGSDQKNKTGNPIKAVGKKIVSPFVGVAQGFKQMNDAQNAKIATEKQKKKEIADNEALGKKREEVAGKFEDNPSAQNKTFSKAVQGQKFGTNMLDAAKAGGAADLSSYTLPMESIEAQFRAKMANMKMSTEEIDAAWDELSNSFDIGGSTVEEVLTAINTKLDETADKTNIASAEAGEFGEGMSAPEAGSAEDPNANNRFISISGNTKHETKEQLIQSNIPENIEEQQMQFGDSMGGAKFGADMAQTAAAQGVADLNYLTLPLDSIKNQFVQKMTEMGVETDKAEEKWKELANTFETEGSTVDQALEAINAELTKTADKVDEAAEAAKPEGGEAAKVDDKLKKISVTGKTKEETKDKKEEAKKKKEEKDKKKDKKKDDKDEKKDKKKDQKAQKQREKTIEKNKKIEEKYAEQTKANNQALQEGYKKTTESIGKVGTTLTGAGMACGMLGGAFRSLGMDGVAETFEKFGNILTSVGGIMSVLQMIMGFLQPIIWGNQEATEELAEENIKASASGTMQAGTAMGQAAANTALAASEAAASGGATALSGGLVSAGVSAIFAQIACWPLGLVLLVILAVVLTLVIAIVALIAVFKAIKNATPEAKLQKAQEAAEEAAEAADRAAEAYQNLKDSLDDLDDKYAALDELTQGTREWNDAVNEINDSVIDLIDKYPELASLVQSEGGVLKLDTESEEVQGVLNKYQATATSAKNQEYAAKIDVVQAEQNLNYDRLSNEAKVGSQAIETGVGIYSQVVGAIGATLTPLLATGPWLGWIPALYDAVAIGANEVKEGYEQVNRDRTDALAQALSEGIVVQDEDGSLRSLDDSALAQLGLTTQELKYLELQVGDNINELKEYGATIAAANAQMEALYQGMASNALSAVLATENLTEAQKKYLSTVADADWAETHEQNATAKWSTLSKEEKKLAKEEYAKQQYGENFKEIKGNKIIYLDEDGKKQKKKLTDEEWANIYGTQQGTKDMQAALKNLPNAISKVSMAAQKRSSQTGDVNGGNAIKALFSAKEGSALTRKDLESLTNNDGEGFDIRNVEELRNIWSGLTDEEKKAFGSFKNFSKDIVESVNIAQAAYEGAYNRLKEQGGQIEIQANISSEAYKGLMDKLIDVTINSGQEGLDKVGQAFNNITSGMSDDQASQFTAALNAIDWQNATALEDFPNTLKELGISVPTEELNNLIDSCIEAAGAIQQVDFEKLTESIQSTQAIIKNIQTGEQTRAFSSEDYEAIIAADATLAEQFVMNTDGEFTYIGDKMEDLVSALQDNTTAVNKSQMDQLQSQVDAATLFEQVNTGNIDATNTADWDSATLEHWLTEYRKQLNASQIDISDLGVGISNDTDISKMTKEQMEEIISNISEMSSKKAENQQKLDQYGVSNRALAYQQDSAAKNANSLAMYRDMASSEGFTQDAKNDMEARTIALKAQAVNAGVSEEELSTYNEALKALNAIDLSAAGGVEQYQRQAQAVAEIETELKKQIQADEQIKAILNEIEYDWDAISNLEEKSNAILRERDQLEREYERLLNSEKASVKDITDYNANLIDSLEAELKIQEQIKAEAQNNFNDVYSQIPEEMKQFIKVDAETGEIQADQEGYAQGDEIKAENFSEIVDKLVISRDQSQEADDAMMEILDTVDEIRDQGKEEYNELLEGVQEALIDSRQKEIDKLSEVNESINSAQEALISKMQDQIAEQRQARENAKTEQDLTDKQARIAALQRDTSGGNAVEIAKLQKELGEAEQNYQDKLVDQAIDNLAKQNEKAANQREQQIDLLQAQLDHWEEFDSAREAEQILNDSLAEAATGNTPFAQTVAGSLIAEAEGIKGMTDAQKEDYLATLNQTGALSAAYLTQGAALESKLDEVTQNILTAFGKDIETKESGQQGAEDIGEVVDNVTDTNVQGSAINAPEKEEAQTPAEQLSWWEAFWQAVGQWFVNLWNGFTGTLSKIWNWIVQKIFVPIGNFFKKIWDGIVTAALWVWDKIKKGLIDPIKKFFSMPVDDFKKMWQNMGKAVSDFFGGIWQWITDVWNGIIGFFSGIWDAVVNFFSPVIEWFRTNIVEPIKNAATWLWEKVISPIVGFFQKMFEIIKTIFDIFWQVMTAVILTAVLWIYDKVILPIANFFKQLWEGIKQVWNTVADWFKTKVIDPIVNWFKGVWEKVSGFFISLWNGIKEVWNTVSSWFKEHVIDPVVNWFKGVWEKVSGFFTKLWEDIKGVWNTVADWFDEHVIKPLTAAFEWLGEQVGKIWENIIIWFEKLINSMVDGINWVINKVNSIQVKNPLNGEVIWSPSIKTIDASDLNKDGTYARFATGGLANYTGPAWLDGTPSKPELVLNAQDTQNFLALKDVLADVMKHGELNGDTSENGNNYYDIAINVEKIDNDYDVEQMANKIKEMIYEDSTYRNVNTINQIR